MILNLRNSQLARIFRILLGRVLVLLIAVALLAASTHTLAGAEIVFPGAAWETKKPEELGLDAARLKAVETALGSRGCVVKNGYVVWEWGSQSKKGDWASSGKPVLSTLLMFAMQEGRVKSPDQPIADFGWPLSTKDRTMTFRHLASMSSGYARPEAPGAAWAYNDFAIQLYQKTLFDKVFQGRPEEVFHAPERFGALQLQDRFSFRESNRRMSGSVRDFARIAWLWLNLGNWNGKQILPRGYFDDNLKPQVPRGLPNSSDAKTNDYLQIGTYGGGSNHFSKAGPGLYGFNWWFNNTIAEGSETRSWPDAPPDAFMSIGVRGNCSVMMPSLNLVVVAGDADWGELDPGNRECVMNQRLKAIAEAGTPHNSSSP